MRRLRKSIIGVAMIGLIGASLVQSAPALAKAGDIVKQGNCSNNSDWKLKLSADDGRIEVEFEVDQNSNGDTWSVKMNDNGDRFFKGERTTKGPSGSFSVTKFTDNQAGPDKIVANATNQRTGETCRGTATL
jgi:hypothetical protein